MRWTAYVKPRRHLAAMSHDFMSTDYSDYTERKAWERMGPLTAAEKRVLVGLFRLTPSNDWRDRRFFNGRSGRKLEERGLVESRGWEYGGDGDYYLTQRGKRLATLLDAPDARD